MRYWMLACSPRRWRPSLTAESWAMPGARSRTWLSEAFSPWGSALICSWLMPYTVPPARGRSSGGHVELADDGGGFQLHDVGRGIGGGAGGGGRRGVGLAEGETAALQAGQQGGRARDRGVAGRGRTAGAGTGLTERLRFHRCLNLGCRFADTGWGSSPRPGKKPVRAGAAGRSISERVPPAAERCAGRGRGGARPPVGRGSGRAGHRTR